MKTKTDRKLNKNIQTHSYIYTIRVYTTKNGKTKTKIKMKNIKIKTDSKY